MSALSKSVKNLGLHREPKDFEVCMVLDWIVGQPEAWSVWALWVSLGRVLTSSRDAYDFLRKHLEFWLEGTGDPKCLAVLTRQPI